MHTPPFRFFVGIHWFIVPTALFPTPSLSHMLSRISLLSYTSDSLLGVGWYSSALRLGASTPSRFRRSCLVAGDCCWWRYGFYYYYVYIYSSCASPFTFLKALESSSGRWSGSSVDLSAPLATEPQTPSC